MIPTLVPSFDATLNLNRPSFNPTVSPTPLPTVVPTFSPTFSLSSLWSTKYNMLLQNISSINTNTLSSISIYSEVLVNGMYIYGGCKEWQSFVGGTLILGMNKKVVSISMTSLLSLNNNPTSIQCIEENLSNSFTTSIINGNTVSNIICNDNNGKKYNWTSFISSTNDQCSSTSVGICVNCTKTNQICENRCNNTYSIVPCQNSNCIKSNHIRILQFNYRPSIPAPNITLSIKK